MIPSLALCLLFAAPPFVPQIPGSLTATSWKTARRTTVLTAVEPDGTVYAKGANWKLQFSRAGVKYYPVLGARAKQAYALDLTLAEMTVGDRKIDLGSAAPVLGDSVVTCSHGADSAVIERYDLSVDSVEQTFVLNSNPLRADERGDLTIRCGSESSLAFRGRDHGLVFDAGGLGRVVYGDVTVRDARGASWQLQSDFEGGALRLTVPNSVLRIARFPLAIDPLITNLVIDADGDVDTDPAIAFTNGHYLVAYTEIVSGLDTDIISRRFDAAGNFLEEVGVELAVSLASDPEIAGTGDTFLTVWQNRSTFISDPVIQARSRVASTTSQGAIFAVTSGFSGEAKPDVGATPTAVATNFFVVWQDDSDPITRVRGRTASPSGGLGAVTTLLAGNNNSFDPHVSKDAGPSGIYLACFESIQIGVSQTLAIRGVDDGGATFEGAFGVATHSVGVPFHADVAGDGANFAVVYENADPVGASAHDIVCEIYQYLASSNHVKLTHANFNLSKAEINPIEFGDQIEPEVTMAGCRITYGYRSRQLVISDYDLKTATFAIDPLQDGEFAFIETAAQLAPASSAASDHLALAAGAGQLNAPVMFAWQAAPGATSDIFGQLRSVLGTGGVTKVQTGCGAPEPSLAIGGPPAIGGFITLAIGNTVNPLLAIGIPTTIPLCPGQGGCILGVNPITMVPIASTITQVPCDPGILGFSIGLQIIDLLPANATGTMCAPPKFTQKFRVSDTSVLTFQ